MFLAMPTRAFIAYDFALITGTLFKNVLDNAKATQPAGLDLHYPGDDGEAKEQGTIWGSLVKTQIDEAEKVIAFVDLPNANVGFEIGYACGMGKPIGVYRFKDSEHPWLKQHPLRGHFRHQAKDAKAIHNAFLVDNLITIKPKPLGGDGVTVLCPSDGEPLLEQIQPEWNWKRPPLSVWNLDDTLPKQFADTGLVVWIITPHGKGADERDGSENTALSILAGYAEARPEIDLRVFIHTGARAVVDLEHCSKRFTSNAELKNHLESLVAEWRANVVARAKPAPTLMAVVGPLSFPSTRPSQLPPHPDDPYKATGDLFIGRESELGVAADSVEGLMDLFRTGTASSGARGFRLIWAHGFGGMGKSWYLQRIRLLAEARHPEICSIIIDWDKSEWLSPLTGTPKVAADVFDLIATRLAQRLGIDAAEPYWQAKARVEAVKDEHKRAMDRFESQLQLSIKDEAPHIESHLLQILKSEGIWEDDREKRIRRIDLVRTDRARYRDIFGAWCQENGETTPAIVCPNRERAAGLREALRVAMKVHALVFLLDTCEVLDDDLDGWLRELLAPLFRAPVPLLVLVGSRLRPDLHQPSGSRKGWRVEVPQAAVNIYDFGENRRFTVPEIDAALAKLTRPVGGDHNSLAEMLHRVTLGIPLAVRALLDFHNAGDDLLTNLTAPGEPDRPLSERKQVRFVIDQVSARFLLNLQDRPEREDDLRDIIALALLPAYEHSTLAKLWTEKGPANRIRDLAGRYSLLSDGDLHPTVRNYLRRYWREEKNRPEVFADVLSLLAGASKAVSDAQPSAEPMQRIAHRVAEINLCSWTEGDAVVDDLARVLCLARVYEADGFVLESLLAELPLAGPAHAASRKLWHRDDERPTDAEIVPWLKGQCATSRNWTDEEQAALALLDGFATSSRSIAPEKALAEFAELEKAISYFGLVGIPRTAEVGAAYFDCAHALDPFWAKQTQWIEQAASCYERSIGLHHLESIAKNNVANLYQDYLGQPEKAEKAYHDAIVLDPKFASPHDALGNLYQVHLGQPEKAEQAYRDAIALDPKAASPHNGLGWLYQDYLGQPEKAEQAYLNAIALDPKAAIPHNGLGWLYQNYLGQPEKSEQAYRDAIALDPKAASPHNGLGSLYEDTGRWEEATAEYQQDVALDTSSGSGQRGLAWVELLARGDIDEARHWVAEAAAVDAEHFCTPLVEMAVNTWAGEWPLVQERFERWVPDLPKKFEMVPWTNRRRLATLLRKAREAGKLEPLADILLDHAERGCWRPWVDAVDVIRAERDASTLSDPKAAELYRLLTLTAKS